MLAVPRVRLKGFAPLKGTDHQSSREPQPTGGASHAVPRTRSSESELHSSRPFVLADSANCAKGSLLTLPRLTFATMMAPLSPGDLPSPAKARAAPLGDQRAELSFTPCTLLSGGKACEPRRSTTRSAKAPGVYCHDVSLEVGEWIVS